MISRHLTAFLAIACTLKNSSASNLATGTVTKKDSSSRISESSLINLLAKPTGKLLDGYFTYIGYSDPECKFVGTATSSKLNTCTPSSVGSSFILTANSTTLFTAVYADLSCSSSDFYAPSSFTLQVCGPGYRSYLLTPSLPDIKSSEPLLLSSIYSNTSSSCSTVPLYKEYFATSGNCVSGTITSIIANIASQDVYTSPDCTGPFTTNFNALNVCVLPSEDANLGYTKWTYDGIIPIAPSVSPTTRSSSISLVTSLAPSSSSSSLLVSVAPSRSTTSPDSPSTIITGYVVMTRYTDATCNSFATSSSLLLNTCILDGKGSSKYVTVKSSIITEKAYADTTCTKEIGSIPNTYSESCNGGMRYSISATGTPSITVASVNLRSYAPSDSSCASTVTQVETAVFDLCYGKVIVSVSGLTLKYSTYTDEKCSGTPRQVTLGLAGKCDKFNSVYALATLSESGTTPASSTAASSSKGCFAGSETLNLESGEMRLISDIRVGDRVLAADAAGQTSYSDVVFVPHRANNDDALFTHITTTSGRDIKMTPSHIILAGPCHLTGPLPLIYASSVSLGDCVMTVSGKDTVSIVETVQGKGLYTVVTKEEYVVVNGIMASPFAMNHMLANLFYNLHRFVYASLPTLLDWSLLHSANEALGTSIFLQWYST